MRSIKPSKLISLGLAVTTLATCLAITPFVSPAAATAPVGDVVVPGVMTSSATSVQGRYVAFSSIDRVMPYDTNMLADVWVTDRVLDVSYRISQPTNFDLYSGQTDGDSTDVTMSQDGRYIAFASTATNLIADDTNDVSDVFVADRALGSIRRLSLDDGAQLTVASTSPVISADGTKISFTTTATFGNTTDTGGYPDVYRLDLASGEAVRISLSYAGTQISNNATLKSTSMSADGSKVVFQTTTPGYASADIGTKSDVYVRTSTGTVPVWTTEQVSIAVDGTQLTKDSTLGAISPDGSRVAFVAYSSGTGYMPLVREISGTRLTWAPVGITSSYTEVWAGDGPVATAPIIWTYASGSNNGVYRRLGTGDTVTSGYKIIGGGKNLPDLTTGCGSVSNRPAMSVAASTNLISFSWSNSTPTSTCSSPTTTFYENVVGAVDVGAAPSTEPLWGPPTGWNQTQDPGVEGRRVVADLGIGTKAMRNVSISDDATRISFNTTKSLVSADTNTTEDAYISTDGLKTFRLVSRTPAGAPANAVPENPVMSADGRYVAFSSAATNLRTATDTNGSATDIYVYDVATEAISIASLDATGAQSNQAASVPALSGDGHFVTFQSDATNLLGYTGASPKDSNGVADVFRKDRLTGAIVRVSTKADGSQLATYSWSSTLGISYDGSKVTYLTANKDVSVNDADSDTLLDVYLWDSKVGGSALVSPGGTNDTRWNAINAAGTVVTYTSDSASVGGDVIWAADLVPPTSGHPTYKMYSSVAPIIDGYAGSLASADGRYVTVWGAATPNGQIKAIDRQTGEVTILAEKQMPTMTTGCGGPWGVFFPVGVSNDGRHIATSWNNRNSACTSTLDNHLYVLDVEHNGVNMPPRPITTRSGTTTGSVAATDDIRQPWTDSAVDLTVASSSLPINFARSYVSAPSSRFPCGLPQSTPWDEPFGPGWTHSYNLQIGICVGASGPTGRMSLHLGNGGQVDFQLLDGGSVLWRTGTPDGIQLIHDPVADEWLLTQKDRSRVLFGADMRVKQVSDALGHHVEIGRNPTSHQIETITDVDDTIITLTSFGGQVTSVGTTDGRNIEYGYGLTGHTDELTTVRDLDGHDWTYRYDADGFVDQVTDPTGIHLTTVTYAPPAFAAEPEGRVAGITNSAGEVTTYSFDQATKVITVTSPAQTITRNVMDAAGNQAISTTTAGITQLFGEKDDGHTHTVTVRGKPDTLNSRNYPVAEATTTWELDDNGNVTTITDPNGHSEHWTYENATGIAGTPEIGPRTYTDADGNTTTYGYDADGLRLTTITEPPASPSEAGAVTHVEVDEFGRVARITRPGAPNFDDPADYATYEYWETGTSGDGLGQIKTETARDGTTTNYTYDGHGNIDVITDGRGQVWDYDTTIAGAVERVTNPDLYMSETTYDDAGRTLTSRSMITKAVGLVDATWATTTYGYNAAGEPNSVIEPGGAETIVSRDTLNRRVITTDPLGDQTIQTYDEAGRLSTVQRPGVTTPRIWEYTYDEFGRQRTSRTPSGSTQTTEYDLGGQVTKVTFSGATGALVASPSVEFDYTNSGLTKKIDPDGSEPNEMTYDGRGLLATSSYDGQSITYDWDIEGNLTGRTYSDGTAIGYTYNDVGQLETVNRSFAIDPFSVEVLARYSYNTTDNEVTLDRLPATAGTGDAGRTVWKRDDVGALERITHTDANDVPLSVIEYTRDGTGMPTWADITAVDDSTGYSAREIYEYSDDRRLTGVCWDDTTPTTARAETCGPATDHPTWTYDAAGNRTHATGPGYADTYNYDDAGQLESIDGTHEAEYTWDRDGNQTSVTIGSNTTTRTWNQTGTMKAETAGTGVTGYGYDALGQRISADNGTDTADWWWDPLPDASGVAQLHTADSSAGDSTTYLDGLAVENYDGSTTTRTWGLADGVGTPTVTVDDTGVAVSGQQFDPYGVPRASTLWGPTSVDGYTGELTDPSGDVHLRARQYDPGTGTFRSDDPAGSDAYRYGGGAPNAHTDPSGRCFDACIIEITVIVAIFAAAATATAVLATPAGRQWTSDLGTALAGAGAAAFHGAGLLINWAGVHAGDMYYNLQVAGGRYADTRGDGMHGHHLISKAALNMWREFNGDDNKSPCSNDDAPSVRVSKEHHYDTESYGGASGSAPGAYRQGQFEEIVENGPDGARATFEKDVELLRSQDGVGDIYDEGIEMARDTLQDMIDEGCFG